MARHSLYDNANAVEDLLKRLRREIELKGVSTSGVAGIDLPELVAQIVTDITTMNQKVTDIFTLYEHKILKDAVEATYRQDATPPVTNVIEIKRGVVSDNVYFELI